jgi:steroid delta-isomerase-like uncharacterized protein
VTGVGGESMTGGASVSPEENKELVRRFVEDVQNEHELGLIDALVHDDFADHSGIMPPELARGREGLKRFFALCFEAFPDLHFTIHDQIAEADRVVTRKTLTGTHKAEFFGVPPTGRWVEVNVIDILTVVDGKLRDHWGGLDRLAMLQQLGVVPD